MKLILTTLLFFANFAFAQEAPVTESVTAVALPAKNSLNLGLSFVQWNEKMNLQSGNLSDEDNANFKGLNFHIEKKIALSDWGWAMGASLGSGLATGGGKSTIITYQKGNQAWTSYGVHAKAFKRMTEQFELGVLVPILYRQVKWPSLPGGLPVDSGKNINVGLLFEMDFKISKKFSFYQDIGPFSSAGATFWRLGFAYEL